MWAAAGRSRFSNLPATMLEAAGSSMEPEVPGEFRLGDTRHTVSDISRMRALGWEPRVPVEQNVSEYLEWLETQSVTSEFVAEADRVMRESGVVRASRLRKPLKHTQTLMNPRNSCKAPVVPRSDLHRGTLASGHGVVGLLCADGPLRRDGGDMTRMLSGNSPAGKSPVVEPKLNALLRRAIESGHLTFTTSYEEALRQAEFVFIAIDTPVNDLDEPQLESVREAARQVGRSWNSGAVLCVTSQVPVGTCESLAALVVEHSGGERCDVAYIPEFLRLGDAVNTFFRADRFVIGALAPEVAGTRGGTIFSPGPAGAADRPALRGDGQTCLQLLPGHLHQFHQRNCRSLRSCRRRFARSRPGDEAGPPHRARMPSSARAWALPAALSDATSAPSRYSPGKIIAARDYPRRCCRLTAHAREP